MRLYDFSGCQTSAMPDVAAMRDMWPSVIHNTFVTAIDNRTGEQEGTDTVAGLDAYLTSFMINNGRTIIFVLTFADDYYVYVLHFATEFGTDDMTERMGIFLEMVNGIQVAQ